MPRRMIAIALVAAAGAAHAQPAPDPIPTEQPLPGTSPDPGPSTTPAPGAPPPVATTGPAIAAPTEEPNEIGDQTISVQVGAAGGGRVTPGGLRIAGQFLYQLSDEDWFDGAASFTFGSGSAACFRDRQDHVVCSHGVADGSGVEISASVRRMFAAHGVFRPFARLGVGLGLARFGDDDVSGFTIPAHAGGGLRVAMSPAIALVAEGELAFGFGSFSRGLGSQLQFGLAITAGAEFRLR